MVKQPDFPIEKIIRHYHIKPLAWRGQNFLVNQTIVNQMVDAAAIRRSDVVLEIGPGFGILSEALAKKAQAVWAVEIDKKLVAILKDNLSAYRNLKIISGDILIKFPEIIDILPSHYKIVASLPFQITSRFLRMFLEAANPPTNLTIIVQKELGERICAKAGKMSLISVLVQFFGQPEIVQIVKKENFWPQPEVDAVILNITDVGKGYSLNCPAAQTRKFWQVARIGFSSRRKQLHNNLASGLGLKSVEAKKLLTACGLDICCRAQELTIDQWRELAKLVFLDQKKAENKEKPR